MPSSRTTAALFWRSSISSVGSRSFIGIGRTVRKVTVPVHRADAPCTTA